MKNSMTLYNKTKRNEAMGIKKVILQNEKHTLEDDVPKYGINYGRGYIGFCYDESSWVSKKIARATKFFCYSKIKISHALIVIDENNCIEASAKDNKVVITPLKEYFDNEKKLIIFRKPKNLTIEASSQIVETAKSKLGCGHEKIECLGHLYKGLPFIRQIHKFTNNIIVDKISKRIDNPNQFICSELAAFCLKSATKWQYHDKGILKRETTRVNPQELFEDKIIFENWEQMGNEKETANKV